ncbi:MAG: LemA family protein [Isosphaeraceae bacterium]
MLYALGGAAAAVLLYLVWTYNRLVGLSKRADGAWSDIDVQLKRRWDLVPALVETVKGYTGHESSTLQAVTEARARATESASGSPQGRGGAERSLASAVGGVFALAEAYPDLKASRNFLDLQKSLTEIEDSVQYARRYYNAVVRDYNTLTETFPTLLVASAGGFARRDFFQLDDPSERAAPQVRL